LFSRESRRGTGAALSAPSRAVDVRAFPRLWRFGRRRKGIRRYDGFAQVYGLAVVPSPDRV
jgi:hypothetical protein